MGEERGGYRFGRKLQAEDSAAPTATKEVSDNERHQHIDIALEPFYYIALIGQIGISKTFTYLLSKKWQMLKTRSCAGRILPGEAPGKLFICREGIVLRRAESIKSPNHFSKQLTLIPVLFPGTPLFKGN